MDRRYIGLGILAIGAVVLVSMGSDGQLFGLSDNDLARLVYGVALLAVIGTFALSSGRLSGGLRMIAIWLAIFLVMVAGDQYRYELQDVAARLSGGLIAGSPISNTDSEGRKAVFVDKGGDGHFQVRATVDGSTVTMLVDTGATSTVLTQRDALRIGLDVASLSYTVPISTANGLTQAAPAQIGEIAVGTISRRNMRVLVAQPSLLDQSLLGMDFLSTLSGVDLRGDRLILRD